MATYTSKTTTINRPIGEVYDRLSDFSTYQAKLDTLPDEVKSKIGDVRFTTDEIVINAPAVGEIAFEVIERSQPSKVALKAKNAPVSMILSLNLSEASAETTNVVCSIDVDIPAVLKPMVGGKMQEAAEKFAEMIATFFGAAN